MVCILAAVTLITEQVLYLRATFGTWDDVSEYKHFKHNQIYGC